MNRITEGVGKKIVEALKQQSDIEIQNVMENPIEEERHIQPEFTQPEERFNNFETNDFQEMHSFSTPNMPVYSNIEKESFASDLEGFEIPTNVSVLKQLISQLPAGVSKQTGAQIIKQTMEALGISMKAVLQEAQQVQEGLSNSTKECQASIMEYRKQIGVLERQAQKYQRQYAALNDIISLFVQTNL